MMMKSPLQGVLVGFVAGLAVGFILHNLKFIIGIAIVVAIAYFFLRPKRP